LCFTFHVVDGAAFWLVQQTPKIRVTYLLDGHESMAEKIPDSILSFPPNNCTGISYVLGALHLFCVRIGILLAVVARMRNF
jgi:hypothetical protein